MIRHTADFWIRHLQLTKHIEGGWYKEVYRSSLIFNKNQLSPVFNSERNACTHIYFLLEKNQFSAFHKIKSDELWHFYAGDSFIIYEIDKEGELIEYLLGNNIENAQSLFCTIQAGNWFAATLADGEYGLAGCTVAPGFDFNDFEMAKRDSLLQAYPQYAELINRMT